MSAGTMANHITIDVSTTPVSYSPSPDVKHGDTVVFTLGNALTATATITFPDGTCLTTSGPYTLGGPTMATAPLVVALTAARRVYAFDVDFNNGQESRARHGHEWDRKNGGIDVTSDPPEEARR
ncbi:hypothetical protein [Corallococcus aberystwythensis]|uniref:Uncharacterized protein n=1 Tax=Corallococcus aberystwythensis TaxID=2316722 RepID=A0A3A8Q4G8_9BACT|nr:hypothetical protein [Corallococcus aberystwythensis]RKH59772.1 hypothetical protein D7W81_26765 [Corallococcus aberystwythensis]